jgi:hypothetical protein
METAEFLAAFASAPVREHILGIDGSARVATSAAEVASVLARQSDPDYRARDAEEIMLRKNWAATGALRKEDRPAALDLIGVASQLVFNTFVNGHLAHLEKHHDDLDLIYGVADAHNRAMLDFCSVDRRLLATAYVPLADFERSRVTAEGAIRDGFAGLLIPSQCPRSHSPSHTDLFPLWAMAEEAACRSCSTSAAAASCWTRCTSATACRCPRTSMVAPRTSARWTTWQFRPR